MRGSAQKAQGQRRRGFTLVEFVVALAIIVLALIVLVAYQVRASSAQIATHTVPALNYMLTAVRKNFAQTNSYAEVTPALLHRMGVIQKPLYWDGASIRDGWGNVVPVSGGVVNGRPQLAIIIGGVGLTGQACSALASAFADEARWISVGAGVASGYYTMGPYTYCNSAPGPNYTFKSTGNAADWNQLGGGCGAPNPKVCFQFN